MFDIYYYFSFSIRFFFKFFRISKESDEKNIAELFGASVENKSSVPNFLQDEIEHINLANRVAQILEKSEAKIHVTEFFKQLLQGVYNKLGSKEYQVPYFLNLY